MKRVMRIENNRETSVEERISNPAPAVEIEMPHVGGQKKSPTDVPQETMPIPKPGDADEMPQMGGRDYSHLIRKDQIMLPPPKADEPLNLPKSNKDEFKGLGNF